MMTAALPAAAGSQSWQAFLRDHARQMGLDITTSQAILMASHASELARWNRKVNLTTITDPAEMAVKHFLDSLVPADHLFNGATLLDMGSGGGFPGIPLKIVNPALKVTLLDATRKKISFLTQVIRLLELDDIRATRARAEEPENFPGPDRTFDIIICRALASLDRFVELALPFLKPGGRLIAMKGDYSEDKIVNLKKTPLTTDKKSSPISDLFAINTHDYRLPLAGDQRRLIILDHLRPEKAPNEN
ncbi:MAG: 16S rRNA (guanine(527)-N(7))-methyltransferase RsmG [Desulfosudaceae bacterium]